MTTTKKNSTPTTAPLVLTAIPKQRKQRERSDDVIARHDLLSSMAADAGEVIVNDENGEAVATYPKAFLVTGDMLGVKDSSIPVTVATWAKEAGVAHSVVTRHGYPLVVLS